MKRYNKLLKFLRVATLLIAVIWILTGVIKGGTFGILGMIGTISLILSSIIALILKLY